MKYQKKFLIFFYAFIFQHQFVSATSANFKIIKAIGFFSICGDEYDHQGKTELNTEALFYSEMIKNRFSKPCLIKDQCEVERTIDFRYYDVCHDGMKLGHRVLDLLLDLTNFVEAVAVIDDDNRNSTARKTEDLNSTQTIDNHSTISNPVGDSNVHLVLSYLDPALQDVLTRMLFVKRRVFRAVELQKKQYLRYAIPNLILNRNIELADDIKNYYSLTWEGGFESKLISSLELIGRYGWQKVGFVYLRNDHAGFNIYKDLHRFMSHSIHERHPEMCYYKETYDLNNKTSLYWAMRDLHEDEDSVIFLFGLPDDQIKFVRTVDWKFEKALTWVLYDVHLEELKVIFDKAKTKKLFSSFNTLLNRQKSILPFWPETSKSFTNFTEALDSSITSHAFVQVEWIKTLLKLEIKYAQYSDISTHKLLVAIQLRMFDSERLNSLNHPYFIVKQTHCTNTPCQPGLEQKFGAITIPTEQQKWNFEFGWFCQKCPLNRFKQQIGNQSCQPCSTDLLSDENRLFCYDPYIQKHFNQEKFFYIYSGVCFLGASIDLMIASLFTIKRDTPICKASDFKLTIFHLLIGFTIKMMLFLSYKTTPTFIVCHVSLLAYSALYSLFLGIVLMKSHKILKAFAAKRRASSKDKRNTNIQQSSIIVLVFMLGLLLMVAVSAYKSLEVASQKDKTLLVKITHCSNRIHSSVAIALAIILQIACLVTAYRGRNLPSIFNNSMSMVYASFIGTVTFAVALTIQQFEEDPFAFDSISWVAMSVNLILYDIFCYGDSVFILLFKPEKNTKRYIKGKTFEAMSRMSDRLR